MKNFAITWIFFIMFSARCDVPQNWEQWHLTGIYSTNRSLQSVCQIQRLERPSICSSNTMENGDNNPALYSPPQEKVNLFVLESLYIKGHDLFV